ncbi:hypothetical protein [Streptomyces sp. NPDC020607]|uniref:hypothetical protein n=1 Tax=Streptomyces sp. NPDC020607 TaxID=3365082 RepID=UPI0037A68DB9
MEPTRVEQLVDDEWKPVHGITNVVIYDEQQITRITERIREVQDAMTALMHAYAEAARPLLEQVGRAFQTLHQARLVESDGKPTMRRDRPAWQSPYGPPARRH